MLCYAIKQEVTNWVTCESLVLLNFELMFFSLIIQISPAYFFKKAVQEVASYEIKNLVPVNF